MARSGTGVHRAFARVLLALALMLGVLVAPGTGTGTSAAAVPRISLPVEKYTLPNGLEVILQRDPHLPTVATNVMYHVGAADEVRTADGRSRTGFAHLFEHMMFEGSGHVPEGKIDTLLEAVGAYNNAYTNFDVTDYQFANLPADQLELALWLDSDRMGFLLDRLDQTSLANQKAVVRNERREWEQSPYGLTDQEVYQQLFPEGHPYRPAVIGSHADIQAATLDDVREFFRTYYVPNNATLAVVGNFDTVRAKKLIAKYFGTIKRGAEPPAPAIDVPTISPEKRVTLTDEVELPKVTMAWLTPPAFTPGDADATVTAQLLAGAETGRLYTALVRKRKIAQEVTAHQESQKHPSIFTIQAVAKPGRTAKELEEAIDAELAVLRGSGPTARELAAAQTVVVSDLVRRLENLGDAGGRADLLNIYNHYVGRPGYVNADIARYTGVGRGEVRAFAQKQLATSARVVIHTNPGKRVLPPDPPAPPDPPPGPAPGPSAEPWRNEVPGAGPAPKVPLPAVQRFTMGNGMPVYLVESHYLPVVTASVVSRYGSAADPRGRAGLASFVATMLRKGTNARDADAVGRQVAGFGGLLDSHADRDGSSLTVHALSPQAGRALALAAALVRRPAFRAGEISRVRDDLLVGLQQAADVPEAVAWALLQPAVYGARHPYGHLPEGTTKGLTAITRRDLVAFHDRAFNPANAALVLAGDLTRTQARALATSAFGTWRGSGPPPPVPGPGTAAKERVVVVDAPGASQTALEVGQVALPRSAADFEKLAVANKLLGGLFSSRLNNNIRETHGYSYGAASDLASARGPGTFDAYTSVETRHTGASVREILREIRRLRTEKMSSAELRRGIQSYVREVPAYFESTYSAAYIVTDLYLYDLPADHYARLGARLEGYTPRELREVVARNLHPKTMKIIAVGNAKKIKPQLNKLKLGKVVQRGPGGALAGPR